MQLHKSHCNLCCVIIGFRCLPLGRRRAEQGHRPSQDDHRVLSVFAMFVFFNVSLFSRVHSEFLALESRSSFEIFSRLKMCCMMASWVVAEHLTFRSPFSEIHGFTSPVHAWPTQKPESGRSRAPSGGSSTRACLCTHCTSSQRNYRCKRVKCCEAFFHCLEYKLLLKLIIMP